MRRRPERSRFPAWVEDGATYSASEVFLDPLSPLYPCLGLASPQLLHPRGLSVKPLPRPLMHPLASPGQSQARPVQSSSGVSHYLLPGLIVWWGPVSLQPPPPLPGDAPRYWPRVWTSSPRVCREPSSTGSWNNGVLPLWGRRAGGCMG